MISLEFVIFMTDSCERAKFLWIVFSFTNDHDDVIIYIIQCYCIECTGIDPLGVYLHHTHSVLVGIF